MASSKKIKALIPAVLFIMLIIIVMGIIAILPYDRPATSPTNSFLNLDNGGFVATDGSMTYYVDGEHKLFCKSGENDHYIATGVDTLCPYGVGIIYRTEKGEVVYSDYDGGNKRTFVKGAKAMRVSGNWVFYTDSDGILNKYFIKDGRKSKLGLKADSFLISGTAVLFLDDGKLYTARTDGSEKTPFFAEKVDSFGRFESYTFYTSGGKLYSVDSGNTANKQSYYEADEFNISSEGVLFFTKDGELFSKDITDGDAEVRKLETDGKVSDNICCLNDRVYYYVGGELMSCLEDGSEPKPMK